MPRKIMDLEQVEFPFSSEIIDNCFYIKNLNKPTMASVPMRSVFKWIKDQAMKDGLTVEIRNKEIFFLKAGK